MRPAVHVHVPTLCKLDAAAGAYLVRARHDVAGAYVIGRARVVPRRGVGHRLEGHWVEELEAVSGEGLSTAFEEAG